MDVVFDESQRACTVVVPDYQLSLAIGKRGQNARLAAKLTGFKIDIKPESEWEALKATEVETAVEEVIEEVLENSAEDAMTFVASEEIEENSAE